MPAEPLVPAIRVHRPRTSPSDIRLTARQAAGGPEEAGAGAAAMEGDHEIELLEYEWPDLPPLPTIKDAITRNRVSHGISYLLPVDKGRNSINNRFRTDLRAMFQEPYASDDLQYDDNRVKVSSKVHFLSNSGDTKWTRRHLQNIPVSLNADSEKMRRLYAHSAPTGGTASRRMGIDSHKLRKRSNLYLPLKATIPPELVKLRKEVEQIIKSVKEDDEEYDEEQLMQENAALLQSQSTMRLGESLGTAEMNPHPQAGDAEAERARTAPAGLPAVKEGAPLRTGTLAAKLQSIHVCQEKYDTYDQLKVAKPPKPQIPASVRSQYLNDQQNQDIWEWLHHGEQMNDFDFFLSVCG